MKKNTLYEELECIFEENRSRIISAVIDEVITDIICATLDELKYSGNYTNIIEKLRDEIKCQ